MGTEITLDIGDMTLTYSKNHMGIDHGSLFQNKDRKRHQSDQINYDHFIEIDEELVEMEMAFVRPLQEIVPRLELLGFNLKTVEYEYNKCAKECYDTHILETSGNVRTELSPMIFKECLEFINRFSTKELNNTTMVSRFDETKKHYFNNTIDLMHPYAVLRILAENSTNLNEDVVWQYGPLIEAGWANPSNFIPGAKRN